MFAQGPHTGDMPQHADGGFKYRCDIKDEDDDHSGRLMNTYGPLKTSICVQTIFIQNMPNCMRDISRQVHACSEILDDLIPVHGTIGTHIILAQPWKYWDLGSKKWYNSNHENLMVETY